MLDYFMSSDWAIIATELLAGFFVLSVTLAVLVWRGQRHHRAAAERLLEDRDPILKATEEMVGRQIERLWPGMKLDEEQQQIYADRSLDAVEAMVEPWLEPKRHDLTGVARQFQRVRQEDLEQLLSAARAHAEASQADDERVADLERETDELRKQRDRQANHLNESLETVNVMVREYGRKFDYHEEPHVATVLKAIVMIQEMEAGADCETAQQRAEDIFTEDLVASPAVPAEEFDDSTDTQETETEAAPAPATASESEPAPDESEESGGEDTVTPEPADTETPASDESPAEASETETSESSPATDEDIEALIAEAQESAGASATDAGNEDNDRATEETTEPAPSAASEKGAGEPSAQQTSGTDDEEAASTDRAGSRDETEPAPAQTVDDEAPADPLVPSENPAPDTAPVPETIAESPGEHDVPSGASEAHSEPEPSTATRPGETAEPAEDRRDEDSDDNGVIDLDDVEIPEEDEETEKNDTDEFDLDDIDALLDAEIAKKHGKSQE